MATCHSRISQYGIKIVELMDPSEEDTWKVRNILESGERIFCYGKRLAAARERQLCEVYGVLQLEIFWGGFF